MEFKVTQPQLPIKSMEFKQTDICIKICIYKNNCGNYHIGGGIAVTVPGNVKTCYYKMKLPELTILTLPR
jgi:hypothetical protein